MNKLLLGEQTFVRDIIPERERAILRGCFAPKNIEQRCLLRHFASEIFPMHLMHTFGGGYVKYISNTIFGECDLKGEGRRKIEDRPEVGIYKRKQENKKTRKQELDQESKKKVFFFFS